MILLLSRRTWSAWMAAILLAACSGGGGSPDDAESATPGTPDPTQGGGDPPPEANASDAFSSSIKTARFLGQATFGPTPTLIEELTGTDAVDWFFDELDKPVTLSLPITQGLRRAPERKFDGLYYHSSSSNAFWITALDGDDQLRQRVAFALSEIFVVSSANFNELWNYPDSIASYHDILKQHAFGNYRDLLEDITYTPAMGFYLTYEGNEKANPGTGSVPDENYAREVMQLFSIGVVGLNPDGTQQVDAPETYTNEDVTGLAKVFTGLAYDLPFGDEDARIDEANRVFTGPMDLIEENHATDEKAFLGSIIPAGTSAEASLEQALDIIAAHPNVPPFIARQLIQRLVMSNPRGDYVERVAMAFENGAYTLPGGSSVGEGRRGDLAATVAAVLFDEDARSDPDFADNHTGLIGERFIRLGYWARAFEAENLTPQYLPILWFTSSPSSLGQQAFRSPSVFNFFRPGYIAPGTESGAAGMTVPELQITNSSSLPGYVDFMAYFIFNGPEGAVETDVESFFAEGVPGYDIGLTQQSFRPDYTAELAVADDLDALLDQLDEKLTYGQLSDETRALIIDAIDDLQVSDGPDGDQARYLRVTIATTMILSSSDFLVLR